MPSSLLPLEDEVAAVRPVLPERFGPLLLASALAGLAITFNRGAYAEPAVLCVVAGLLVLVHRFLVSLGRERRMAGDPRLILSLVWIALFAMVFTALSDPAIIIYAQRPWDVGRKAQWLSLVLLFTYIPAMVGGFQEPRAVRWIRVTAFVGITVWAGVAAIRCSSEPRIDVWGVQMQGAAALAHGKNPYVNVAVHDTGPGTLHEGVPYVYPPTQIYMTLPGWALGDVRYSMLAAIVVSGLAMRFVTGRSSLPSFAKDAPSLFLFLTPKLFFILEQAWIDPMQVMFIVVGIACAVAKRPWWAAIVLGVATTSKQTMFWVAPLAAFCLMRFRWRQWIALGIAAAIPPLPFVIWDFKALKYANFDVLNDLPYRSDALTLNNWVLNNVHVDIPGWVGFLLAGLTVATACWRLRGVAEFALAVATTYYVFFAFNRWAFANYYFLISGLAAVAAATSCSMLRRTSRR